MLRLRTKRQADAFRLDLLRRTEVQPRGTGARTVSRGQVHPDGPNWERLLAFHLTHSDPKLPAHCRNYRFAKPLGRRFQADFAWPIQHLLVEVQGGIWRRGGGAHSRPDHIERDIEKQQCALVLGYRLLPVTPQDVQSGRAVDLVRTLLQRCPAC